MKTLRTQALPCRMANRAPTQPPSPLATAIGKATCQIQLPRETKIAKLATLEAQLTDLAMALDRKKSNPKTATNKKIRREPVPGPKNHRSPQDKSDEIGRYFLRGGSEFRLMVLAC